MPGEIAAERVHSHRIRLVEAADEVGDRVLGVHQAAIHEVARVKEHVNVGAHHLPGNAVGQLNARLGRCLSDRPRTGLGDPPRRRVALAERGDRLLDAILRDPKVGGLEIPDVASSLVGNGDVEHD